MTPLKYIAFLLLLVIAVPASAETVLTVGTTGDYRPVTWLNKDTGRYEGTDIALITAFARDEGYSLRFVPTTWPTLMADLKAGHFMMAVGGISKTEARTKAALMSVPLAITGKVALVRCGEESQYDSLEAIDRAGVRVVENPGGTNERFARAHIRTATLTVTKDNHAPFALLKAHKADVMFTDSLEAEYRQRRREGLCAVRPDAPYTRVEKVFLFRKDQKALRDRFNAWVKGPAPNR
ncbi:transporter substrate-binding domain-containing protein [Kordiimonas marina]|uniref:transporter substrate-binding domain-containing protein n=1 Tax=Kordiimonas marina TaxID=2872312 RepID=UPI001FF1A59E|nr:transporter substrate-binding domain-containing protein [Kordiimonas marina]MCJ9429539.1 transporter substrate-binding domain-containing protein [Kordiimonas marina]